MQSQRPAQRRLAGLVGQAADDKRSSDGLGNRSGCLYRKDNHSYRETMLSLPAKEQVALTPATIRTQASRKQQKQSSQRLQCDDVGQPVPPTLSLSLLGLLTLITMTVLVVLFFVYMYRVGPASSAGQMYAKRGELQIAL